MKPTNQAEFNEKENSINRAIIRVDAILEEFAQGKRSHEEWNDAHDLMYRLEARNEANWSAFKDWHWDTFGFNAY